MLDWLSEVLDVAYLICVNFSSPVEKEAEKAKERQQALEEEAMEMEDEQPKIELPKEVKEVRGELGPSTSHIILACILSFETVYY